MKDKFLALPFFSRTIFGLHSSSASIYLSH